MHTLYKPIRVKADPGQTFIRGFSGNGAFFEPGKKIKVVTIADGTANTIGIIQAGEAVVWSMPGSDIPFEPKKPLPALGKDIDGVFYAGLLDASILSIKRDFDAKAMKEAITIAGDEPQTLDKLTPPEK
jgi:hypothetical protein